MSFHAERALCFLRATVRWTGCNKFVVFGVDTSFVLIFVFIIVDSDS